jgi:hypothetical protein
MSPAAEAGSEEEGGERQSDPLWFLKKKKKPGQKAE